MPVYPLGYPIISGKQDGGTTLTNVMNVDPLASLTRWITARNNALAGNGFARINFYGDSIATGYFANDPQWLNGHVGLVRTAWNTRYGTTPGTGVCPNYVTPVNIGIDERITFNTPWTSFGSGIMNSGSLFFTGLGGIATFTPTEICDSFTLYFFSGAGFGGGTFNIAVDGGTPVLVDATTIEGARKISISAGSPGMHVFTATSLTGNCVIAAFEATLGTSGVLISRTAAGSSVSAQLNDNTDLQFGLMPPDLSIIAIGINDFVGQVDVATVAINISSGIDKARVTGDVILVIETPPGAAETVPWDPNYVNAIRDVAVAKDALLIDFTVRWVSYAVSNASPFFYYQDTLHPNQSGHANMASVYESFLLP